MKNKSVNVWSLTHFGYCRNHLEPSNHQEQRGYNDERKKGVSNHSKNLAEGNLYKGTTGHHFIYVIQEQVQVMTLYQLNLPHRREHEPAERSLVIQISRWWWSKTQPAEQKLTFICQWKLPHHYNTTPIYISIYCILKNSSTSLACKSPWGYTEYDPFPLGQHNMYHYHKVCLGFHSSNAGQCSGGDTTGNTSSLRFQGLVAELLVVL